MPLPAILAALFGAGGTAGAAGAGAAGAGAAGAGAAGAGAAGAGAGLGAGAAGAGAGLTAGEALAAGSLAGGSALAPATGASALGAGAGSGIGALSALSGQGTKAGQRAPGLIQDLQGQMPQMQMPQQQQFGITPEQKAMYSYQAPATSGEKWGMLLDQMGGPKGLMSMMKGTRSVHKPAPALPMPMPQRATQNPFEVRPRQRRANLGMGRIRGRY